MISPIGQYRSNHINPSKGKRSKKRKRKEAKEGGDGDDLNLSSLPPPPQISPFLVVGLNSITRILESSSHNSKPQKPLNCVTSGEDGAGELSDIPTPPSKSKTVNTSEKAEDGTSNYLVHGHFSTIFVWRSSQPTILHAHLPQLVVTASLAYPKSPTTRLVQLPKGSDTRVCEALGLPRVSFIGVLEGAPQSKSLVDFIRDCVPEVDIPWLQETKALKYLPVQINTIETSAPATKKDQKQV
jgi:ribonuclease P/MRP protein subunit POP3